MAKEKKSEENQAQEPQPFTKEKKAGLALPVVIGIIVGTILLVLLAVRFLILPYLVENINPEIQKIKAKQFAAENSKEEHKGDMNLSPEFLEKNTKTMGTGRITTNPKNSTQFVVIDLATMYVPKDEDALKELSKEGGKESKEGGGVPPAFTNTMIQLKGLINRVLGSMTVEELQSRRDSLPSMFKKEFKHLFMEKKCYVRDVIIQEFLIQ